MPSAGISRIVPGVFPSVDDNGGPDRTRGDTALDDTTIQTGFNVPLSPAGAPLATCLSFDFRFLSEEYPDRIASPFNDAFIAELDTSPWTTSGASISAPNNFASLPFGRRSRSSRAARPRCRPRRRPAPHMELRHR